MQSAPAAGPAASDPKWVVIKQWSGRAGRTETEKFTTTGESWRVSWKTLAGDPDPNGSLTIAVRDASARRSRPAASTYTSRLVRTISTSKVPTVGGPSQPKDHGNGWRFPRR
jgi:hypothetical protein